MSGFTESVVEEAALEWLERAGWTKVYGETIAPDSASPERTEFTQTALETRLRMPSPA